MARQRKAAEQAEETPAQEFAPETGTPAVPSDSGQPAAGTEASSPAAREPGEEAQPSWVKRASIIADPEAGVRFHFDYENHKAIITFDERPSPELLAATKPILKTAKFNWDNESDPVGWTRKMKFATREDDRREAKKAFYEVANAIREQKGLPIRSFGEAIPI